MQSCGSGDNDKYSAGGRFVFFVASFGYDESIKHSIPHPKDFYEKIGKKTAFFMGHFMKNMFKLTKNDNK